MSAARAPELVLGLHETSARAPAFTETRMSVQLRPAHYTVDIDGLPVDLPIVAINDTLAISLLMNIDMGVRFGAHVGAGLARRLAPTSPDIVVGTATLGIPVAIEVSRALGLDRYVIIQKSPKIHLADALVDQVQSVTSSGQQRLLLDRAAMPLLAGKRVVVVDDVVATGSSLAAALRLVRQAGGIVVAIGVILTEAHAWRTVLGEDAGKVVSLGHIPAVHDWRGRGAARCGDALGANAFIPRRPRTGVRHCEPSKANQSPRSAPGLLRLRLAMIGHRAPTRGRGGFVVLDVKRRPDILFD